MKTTPFELMAQEVDEVIICVNYYIEKAEKQPNNTTAEEKQAVKKSDGFWDF